MSNCNEQEIIELRKRVIASEVAITKICAHIRRHDPSFTLATADDPIVPGGGPGGSGGGPGSEENGGGG